MKKTAEVLSIVAALVALAIGVKIISGVVACSPKELVCEQGVEFVEPEEPELFTSALFATFPDYTEPYAEFELIDFSTTTPTPYKSEWNLHPIADPNWEWTECSACGKKVHIATRHFCLQQYIPTWPDYIELEKDLVIHRPGKEENEFIVMYFHKGTHIYFRDDDD